MPATVLFLECKSYVIVGIYTSVSEFPCGDVRLMCGVYDHDGRVNQTSFYTATHDVIYL